MQEKPSAISFLQYLKEHVELGVPPGTIGIGFGYPLELLQILNLLKSHKILGNSIIFTYNG